MENISNSNRTVTLSFKTTQEEKTALQQIALEKGISRSELMASIISAFKYKYDYIGKTSPREAELQSKLAEVNKQNRKLILALENAENRIELVQKSNSKYVKEQFQLNKTIFDLQGKLKNSNTEIANLNENIKSIQALGTNNDNPVILWSSMGSLLVSGLALLFAPKLFNS
ncbi:MAG: hypothetical protein Tsb0033_16150 [Winogradskyella sp.]